MTSCATYARNFSVKMRYKIITLILFALIVGCKSKHEVTKRDFKTSDSTRVETRIDTVWGTTVVRDTVFLKVKDPQSSSVLITDPCDSITKKLREFEIRAGNTVISSQNGNISIRTECDSIIEQYSSVEKDRKSLLIQIRKLEEKLSDKQTSTTVSEKTGVVGFFQKWKIGIGWFVAGVVVSTLFWFVMRIIGKV